MGLEGFGTLHSNDPDLHRQAGLRKHFSLFQRKRRRGCTLCVKYFSTILVWVFPKLRVFLCLSASLGECRVLSGDPFDLLVGLMEIMA